MKKRGLNKGLESLLGKDVLSENQNDRLEKVAFDQLIPNTHQPRTIFDDEAIQTLSDSIRQHGIIQPLAVRRRAEGGYEIIAGERRFRAAKRAGLTEVPIVVHDVSDNDSAVFALIENLQREDLNVMEKSKGIQSLIDNFGLTHEACGQALGMSRSSVSNTLRLLDLSSEVQEALTDKVIDMGHARALLSLEKAEQYELLQQIRLKGLSVRETESAVRYALGESEKASPRQKKAKSLKQLEARLSETLGAKVNVSQQAAGNGKITVSFSDEEMLGQLLGALGVQR